MNKIIAACVVACIFAACSDEKQPDHDSSLMTADSTKSAPVITNTDPAVNNAGASALPGALQPATAEQPQQVMAQPVAATAPGMNPPHGQPGHRCDIAVGAALNSAPAKPATVTTTTTPGVNMTAPATAKTVTAPGMNPPHGEPNHRCDIAVGAPLNSAPAKPATTATPTMAPVVTPAISPAKVDSGG